MILHSELHRNEVNYISMVSFKEEWGVFNMILCLATLKVT